MFPNKTEKYSKSFGEIKLSSLFELMSTFMVGHLISFRNFKTKEDGSTISRENDLSFRGVKNVSGSILLS